MKFSWNLLLLAGAFATATSVFAADKEATSLPLTGQSMLKSGQATIIVRMEYCLRNMPELTEPLVAAHSGYSRAAIEAAAILERDFPASIYTFQRVRVQALTQAAADDDLKRARSEGFNRVCPDLLVYLQNATGRSLAKEIGDGLLGAQKLTSGR